MTATLTRPRLRQIFPGAGHIDLAPLPSSPGALDTGDPGLTARLALALLLVRHPQPAPDSKIEYRYAAVDEHGHEIANAADRVVRALLDALRGTDLGAQAQRAALDALGE
ncbi:MAG TPA: hypothetical protein VLT58_08465 [Polyangia bacterium]|nr:hypothetical protein [Polyangia bacterium]